MYLWGDAKRQTELLTHYYPLAARKPCIHSPPLLLPFVSFPPLSICSYLHKLCLSLFLSPLFITHTLFLTTHYTYSFLFINHNNIMKSHVQDRFHDFYHTWLSTLQQILHHLLHHSNPQNDVVHLQHLVNTTTSHIKQYYTIKWAEAHEDVLPFFSPTWLTPLENATSWLTGWKPSSIFHHLKTTSFSFHMSEGQVKKIEELRMRVKMEEEKMEREMERLQVAMADHKVVELAKMSSRRKAVSGEEAEEEEVAAVKGVLEGLERMMKGADCVRLKALKGVLDLLTPLQCVEFLAVVIALQLRLRQWGKKKKMGMVHVSTHVE